MFDTMHTSSTQTISLFPKFGSRWIHTIIFSFWVGNCSCPSLYMTIIFRRANHFSHKTTVFIIRHWNEWKLTPWKWKQLLTYKIKYCSPPIQIALQTHYLPWGILYSAVFKRSHYNYSSDRIFFTSCRFWIFATKCTYTNWQKMIIISRTE